MARRQGQWKGAIEMQRNRWCRGHALRRDVDDPRASRCKSGNPRRSQRHTAVECFRLAPLRSWRYKRRAKAKRGRERGRIRESPYAVGKASLVPSQSLL